MTRVQRCGRFVHHGTLATLTLATVAAIIAWIASYGRDGVSWVASSDGSGVAVFSGDFYAIRGPLVLYDGMDPRTHNWTIAGIGYQRFQYSWGDITHTLEAPMWLLTALLAAYPLAYAATTPLRRGRKRRRLGLCPACGYDLRASHATCPECGRAKSKPALEGAESLLENPSQSTQPVRP